MVFLDRGEALVEEVLEAVVVRLDEEAAAQQIWPPMADGLHEADELSLICSEGAVAWCNRATEERDRMCVLDEHRAEAVGRRVTLHHEGLGEIRQGQHRRGCHSRLEGAEGRRGVVVPREPLLFQERG